MSELLEHADAVWRGELGRDATGIGLMNAGYRWTTFEQVAERTRVWGMTIVVETDDGLLLIDPGFRPARRRRHQAVREFTSQPLHTAIYTHGHADHIWGVDIYAAEAKERGWPAPRVIAQENMLYRFQRYRKTAGFNGLINTRQFFRLYNQSDVSPYPDEYWEPDVTYRDELDISVGGLRAELRHGRGETDDATWVYFPDTGVLCTGDLFVWVAPNAGNPQKVQRYCGEWAEALREMASRNAETLLPGHGLPVVGKERIRQTLEETAEYLESLEEQTVAGMNRGATLDELIHSVKPPAHLADRTFLRAVYDEPEFIVRNIWRLYGGWYEGQPARLKPASEAAQAQEIARFAGGADALSRRAEELAADGDYRLACHLIDWAHLAAPESEEIKATRGAIYKGRLGVEESTMAVGVFGYTAQEMGAIEPAGDVHIPRFWEDAPEN